MDVLAESSGSHTLLLEKAAVLPMTSLEKLDYLLNRYKTFSLEHGDFVPISITLLVLPYLPGQHVLCGISRSAVSVNLVIL